jgi:S-adenosylmethionine synthetase
MTSLSEVHDVPAFWTAQDPVLMPATSIANCFGYACRHNAAMLPHPLWIAHKLARRLASARLRHQMPYLAPDGKTQVGVAFEGQRPVRIHSIAMIASYWGSKAPDAQRFRDDLYEQVIKPAFTDEEIRPDSNTLFFLNPEGPYVTGGPSRHSGLTGRKTATDTYGEFSRHADSALSGKDPGRIDRVGVYAARYAAKNIVAAGIADECEVALTYSIGQAQPVSVQVNTRGSGRVPDTEIAARVQRCFDFRPGAIVRHFNLRHLSELYRGGFYRRLAAYGHVGRMDIGLPWEVTDRATQLRD